jgi:hypothetical protein
MTREWFTTYCQNAAANVLNKDGQIRFSYVQLKAALDGASRHCVSEIPNDILSLDDNIQKLCNNKHGAQQASDNDEYTLLLTLCNIHAAYLMVSGLWKEEPKPEPEGGVDEYGFEIF